MAAPYFNTFFVCWHHWTCRFCNMQQKLKGQTADITITAVLHKFCSTQGPEGAFQASTLQPVWAQGLSEDSFTASKISTESKALFYKRLKIYFAAILRSTLVTSSNLYFITCCVKRWSCMIFLWLLHVKYYNIVASKRSLNGSDVTRSPSCQVVWFLPTLFFFLKDSCSAIWYKPAFLFFQQVGFMCVFFF